MKKKIVKIRKYFSAFLEDCKQVGKQLWEPLHRNVKKAFKFISKKAKTVIFVKNVKVGGSTGDGRNKKKNR